MTKNIIVAGQAAANSGSGALTGWRGLGSLARSTIIEFLLQMGLPASWAPKSNSAKTHAGEAVRRLNNLGFIVRAARKSDLSKTERSMANWDARYIVLRPDSATGEVGDKAGNIVLTVELEDSELKCTGDANLGAMVTTVFDNLRNGDTYTAGKVTEWLVETLMRECGATGYGTGYYIPRTGASVASKLLAPFASNWGRSWAYPMLPVATSEELKQGIANSLLEDITSISTSLQGARADNKMDAGLAGTMMRNLKSIQERLGAYRELCGDALIRPAVTAIALMVETIAPYLNDSAQRFALLDLDGAVTAPQVKVDAKVAVKRAIQERAAEVATAKRGTDGFESLKRRLEACMSLPTLNGLHPQLKAFPEGAEKDALRKIAKVVWNRIRFPQPVKAPEPKQPEPTPTTGDSAERFAMIELD